QYRTVVGLRSTRAAIWRTVRPSSISAARVARPSAPRGVCDPVSTHRSCARGRTESVRLDPARDLEDRLGQQAADQGPDEAVEDGQPREHAAGPGQEVVGPRDPAVRSQPGGPSGGLLARAVVARVLGGPGHANRVTQKCAIPLPAFRRAPPPGWGRRAWPTTPPRRPRARDSPGRRVRAAPPGAPTPGSPVAPAAARRGRPSPGAPRSRPCRHPPAPRPRRL